MIRGSELHIHDNAKTMVRAAADWLCERALEGGDRPAFCLSGGTTPRTVYERLAHPPLVDRFPWSRVNWFWGDERFVPAESPESNYRMVRDAMLAMTPVPAENIHPIPTEGTTSADEAAAAYERTLQAFHGSSELTGSRPLFHVTLLGLGTDGHIASLFPLSPALEERSTWATAVSGSRHGPRITLTLPAIESSRHILFLIAGAAKKTALEAVRRGESLPATRLNPRGSCIWFVDRDAAGE